MTPNQVKLKGKVFIIYEARTAILNPASSFRGIQYFKYFISFYNQIPQSLELADLKRAILSRITAIFLDQPILYRKVIQLKNQNTIINLSDDIIFLVK